jgi:hypothetical protein
VQHQTIRHRLPPRLAVEQPAEQLGLPPAPREAGSLVLPVLHLSRGDPDAEWLADGDAERFADGDAERLSDCDAYEICDVVLGKSESQPNVFRTARPSPETGADRPAGDGLRRWELTAGRLLRAGAC